MNASIAERRIRFGGVGATGGVAIEGEEYLGDAGLGELFGEPLRRKASAGDGGDLERGEARLGKRLERRERVRFTFADEHRRTPAPLEGPPQGERLPSRLLHLRRPAVQRALPVPNRAVRRHVGEAKLPRPFVDADGRGQGGVDRVRVEVVARGLRERAHDASRQ